MNKTIRMGLLGIVVLGVIITLVMLRSDKPVTNDSAVVPSDTISDGVITVPYSKDVFGVAQNADQILVSAYIPPCDPNFIYCLYFNDDSYKKTNFGSAGLRIAKRTDLTSEHTCLETPPSGYEASFVPQATTTGNSYTASHFPKLGDAAAGHYSEGELYRLYIRDMSACYEFETRIAESRFENYEEGSIKKFTDSDKDAVRALLLGLLRHVALSSGAAVNFPR